MRNRLGTCSVVLLFSTPVFAQSHATYSLLEAAPISSACPVGLSASRLGGERVLQAQRPSSGSRTPPGIALRLSFLSALAEARGIASAQITLHGMASTALLLVGQHPRSDGIEALSVQPEVVGQHRFRSTVYTHTLTGIESVELNRVTYSDGSTWHERIPGTCMVQPNPFVRVSQATR